MNIETTQILPNASGANVNNASQVDKENTASTINKSAVNNPAVEGSVATSAVADKSAAPVEIDRENLEAMAQKLQDFVGSLNRGLEFSVHEDSGRDVIKVIDKNSGDTVRQYPSEEVLDLVASLSDAAGTFVNIEA